MEQPFNIIPPVIGHRGAAAYAPENTLASFLKAKQLGVQWVEFDVQLTADEQVCVFHDKELNRTTNGKGDLADYSLSHLKTLDAGSWFGSQFKGEAILSLIELLAFLKKQSLSANIELKSFTQDENVLAEKVVALLETTLWKQKHPFIISSFSPTLLESVRWLQPDFPIGLLMDEWTSDWKHLADDLRCVSVHLNKAIVTQEIVTEIKATGRQVMVFTVNDPNEAKQYFTWGVTALFSDCPDKILPVRA